MPPCDRMRVAISPRRNVPKNLTRRFQVKGFGGIAGIGTSPAAADDDKTGRRSMKPHWLWLTWLALSCATVAAQSRRMGDAEKQWLRMVDPIITYEERREFRRLKTQRERQLYVELFWAKRDDDLTDNVNPYRSEYLARYDYVMANFEKTKSAIPRDQRSLIWLMLGKPDRIDRKIDYAIMGFRFRNRYLQHQPVVWTYDNPGYDYQRSKLKFQLVPTSVFGDFVAFSDNYASVWFDQLKYRMILHPDLEEAPLPALISENFQEAVDLTGGAPETPSETEPGELTPPEERQPQPAPAEPETPQAATADPEPTGNAMAENVEPEPPPVAAADPAAKGEAAPPTESEPLAEEPPAPEKAETVFVESDASDQSSEPTSAAEETALADAATAEAGATSPEATTLEPPDAAPAATPLTTPSPTSSPPADADVDAYDFNASLGNELRAAASLSWFKSGDERALALGRIGVPLDSLDYLFENSQYIASFDMAYDLSRIGGESLNSDRFQSEVRVPSRRALASGKYYARDLALIVPPGRYALRVQIRDVRSGKAAYAETELDVPPLSVDDVQLTDLTIMDPNVDPASAKFRIRETPYALRLSPVFSPRERIRPVLEILNPPSDEALDSVVFKLLSDEGLVRSWNLFPEEISPTNQGTVLIHPELRLDVYAPGPYRLRFEMTLDDGQIAAREANLLIANKK